MKQKYTSTEIYEILKYRKKEEKTVIQFLYSQLKSRYYRFNFWFLRAFTSEDLIQEAITWLYEQIWFHTEEYDWEKVDVLQMLHNRVRDEASKIRKRTERRTGSFQEPERIEEKQDLKAWSGWRGTEAQKVSLERIRAKIGEDCSALLTGFHLYKLTLQELSETQETPLNPRNLTKKLKGCREKLKSILYPSIASA